MDKYTVMVVDDSAFMRKLISEVISEDPLFQVVYLAKNGRDALNNKDLYNPDVMILDIEMPVMNGLEALRIIMEESPMPVIMLASSAHGTLEALHALEIGAFEFIEKPSGSISLDIHKIKLLLLTKLRLAVESDIRKKITHFSYKTPTANHLNSALFSSLIKQNSFEHIVVMGISTGGPKALHQLIPQIPKFFPAPILIVQHMPPKFTKSLADRLNDISQIEVVEARDHDFILPGTAYIAPGGSHMKAVYMDDKYYIELSDEKPINGHRPSIDILFDSLLPLNELKRHAVIMTGMGSDGAKGMKLLRNAGAASTIAESQETCIIFGMPRAAIELDAAEHVLPLHQISTKLIDLVVS